MNPLRLAFVLGAGSLALTGTSAAQDAGRADLSVSVSRARPQCFPDTIEVTGVLAARAMVDVGADREGLKVTQVLIQPLDEVSAGQILARLGRIDDPANAATTPVRAPVAGIVARSNAIVGMPVSARQGPLFGIVSGGEIDLQADLPVGDLARLALDRKATIRPLGQPETTGAVRRIETAASPTTQLGRVTIGLSAGQDLRIGTFARGIVALGKRCGVGVPYSAVSYEAEGTIVHVVNGDRVEARPVETGLLSGDSVEIRTGLAEGDAVVARAGAFVREGDRVNAIAVKDGAGTMRRLTFVIASEAKQSRETPRSTTKAGLLR